MDDSGTLLFIYGQNKLFFNFLEWEMVLEALALKVYDAYKKAAEHKEIRNQNQMITQDEMHEIKKRIQEQENELYKASSLDPGY